MIESVLEKTQEACRIYMGEVKDLTQQLADSVAEIARITQSEREGWRYSDELEKERKMLVDNDKLCFICGRPPHVCDDPECVPANAPLAEKVRFMGAENMRLRTENERLRGIIEFEGEANMRD